MGRWIVPAIGALVLSVAIVAGALIWAGSSGSEASCDRNALADAARDGIAAAERADDQQVTIEMGDGCGDADLEFVLPEVTRDWHVMPGGTLMRASQHSN